MGEANKSRGNQRELGTSMLTAQYAPFETGTPRWVGWRSLITVGLLLVVAVVTIESDLVPESNWAAESNLAQALPTKPHTKVGAKVPVKGVWKGGNSNYSQDPPWEQSKAAPFSGTKAKKGKKPSKKKGAKTKKGKKGTKKTLTALETPSVKSTMKAMMKQQKRMVKKQQAAMKRASRRAEKVKEVNEKTRQITKASKHEAKKMAKKARKAAKKARKHAQQAVKKARRKAKKAEKKEAKKAKLAVKKAKAMAKAAAKSGPQVAMMQADENDIDYDIAYDTELVQKNAKRRKAKKKFHEMQVDENDIDYDVAYDTELVQNRLPSVRFAQSLARKKKKKLIKKAKKAHRGLKTLHNIRMLKAYCLAAKHIFNTDSDFVQHFDSIRKGPLIHLILTFGKKESHNIVAVYAEIMGEMKHTYRQFRGYIVQHVDNAVIKGNGIVAKTLLHKRLVLKLQHQVLGLSEEPRYFRLLAVPFAEYTKKARKVAAKTRHATSVARAAWLSRYANKKMRRYVRHIKAQDDSVANERKQKVFKAALKGVRQKWAKSHKFVPMAPHGLAKANEANNRLPPLKINTKMEKREAKKKISAWEKKQRISIRKMIKMLEGKAGEMLD